MSNATQTLKFYIAKHIGIIYVNILACLVMFIYLLLFNIPVRTLKFKQFPLIASICIVIVFSLAAYYTRKTVRKIPFVLNGVGGYDHSKLKELTSNLITVIPILMFYKTEIDFISKNKVFNVLKNNQGVEQKEISESIEQKKDCSYNSTLY